MVTAIQIFLITAAIFYLISVVPTIRYWHEQLGENIYFSIFNSSDILIPIVGIIFLITTLTRLDHIGRASASRRRISKVISGFLIVDSFVRIKNAVSDIESLRDQRLLDSSEFLLAFSTLAMLIIVFVSVYIITVHFNFKRVNFLLNMKEKIFAAIKLVFSEVVLRAKKRKKRCVYCDERIKISAKKCKHCGEWVEQESP